MRIPCWRRGRFAPIAAVRSREGPLGPTCSKCVFAVIAFGLLTFLLRLGVEGKQTEPRGGGALISETREKRDREWSTYNMQNNAKMESLGFIGKH